MQRSAKASDNAKPAASSLQRISVLEDRLEKNKTVTSETVTTKIKQHLLESHLRRSRPKIRAQPCADRDLRRLKNSNFKSHQTLLLQS